jgi:hypothetical protein
MNPEPYVYVPSTPTTGGSLQVTDVNSLSAKLLGIGDVVIYLLIALAVIFIVWNVVISLISGAKPEEKRAALGNIGYGILGLAIIISLWGLVNILTGTFNTKNNVPTPPSANFVNKSP